MLVPCLAEACEVPCSDHRRRAKARTWKQVRRPIEIEKVDRYPTDGATAVDILLKRCYDVEYVDRKTDEMIKSTCANRNLRTIPGEMNRCYRRTYRRLEEVKSKVKGRPSTSFDKTVSALACTDPKTISGLTRSEISAWTGVPERSVERSLTELEPALVPPELREYRIKGDTILGEKVRYVSPKTREAFKKLLAFVDEKAMWKGYRDMFGEPAERED